VRLKIENIDFQRITIQTVEKIFSDICEKVGARNGVGFKVYPRVVGAQVPKPRRFILTLPQKILVELKVQ